MCAPPALRLESLGPSLGVHFGLLKLFLGLRGLPLGAPLRYVQKGLCVCSAFGVCFDLFLRSPGSHFGLLGSSWACGGGLPLKAPQRYIQKGLVLMRGLRSRLQRFPVQLIERTFDKVVFGIVDL